MEGKRFGIGLAAGLLLALAIVTASGGLGSTPFTAVLAPSAASTPSTTTVATSTVVATATVTMSTTPFPQTTSSTSTLSIASTTSEGSEGSLSSNATYPSNSVSSSSTTFTSTVMSVSSTTNSTPRNQSAVTSATSLYNLLFPPGVNKPTQVASIARQPFVTNAEILAPVLVAFLLGAFFYRIAVQEKERSSED